MDIDDLREKKTLTVREAAEILGVGANNVYTGVRTGEIPSLRMGQRILIPTAKLLAMLGAPEPLPERSPEPSGVTIHAVAGQPVEIIIRIVHE